MELSGAGRVGARLKLGQGDYLAPMVQLRAPFSSGEEGCESSMGREILSWNEKTSNENFSSAELNWGCVLQGILDT